MRILGISAYYHDSAAALLRDGQVIAAAQEERFTRKKHDAAFPHNAVRACLAATGTRIDEIDFVAFYDKPFLKFERLLETYLAFAPRGFTSFRSALPVWVKDKLFQKNTILKELKKLDERRNWNEKLLFSEHHLSHAASAYYPSPFEARRC
jgi:carbamoyltransferase